jgi:hypothetical protein
MSTTIRLKKSGATGNVPSNTSLEFGELALNYADGVLYYKNATNTISQISGTSANTFETINANGTLIIADSNTDILTLLAGDAVTITGNGITDTITIGVRSNNTVFNTATNALATANVANAIYSIATAAFAKANAPITIREVYASNANVINSFSNINTIQFDADSGMAVVDESNNTVTIQLNSTFKNWEVNGNTGLVAFGLDTVNFIAGDGISITANNSNTPKSILFETTGLNSSAFISDTYTANGAQTVYQLSGTPYSSNGLFVFVDGVTQVPAIDYTVSGNILTFTAPPEANGIIEARSVIAVQVQQTSNLVFNSTELYLSNSSYNFSSGGFTTPTDSINRTYILRGTTTNNTESELFLSNSSRVPVLANTTVFYTADIVARRTDAINESAGYQIKGVVDNFSGTVADVGSLYELIVAEDDSGLIVDARADNTNNTINFYVTGSAGKTIRWTALVRTVEVAQ